MGRPARIQQPGAIYHVTAQANRTEPLFLEANDRRMFFLFVRRTVDHHGWHVHAWCALTTHYHLLLTTPRGDLAAGMHRLQSRYAHWFNYEHAEVGHVFRRRYGARHVQTDEHLRWCYRYIALNPVKAGLASGRSNGDGARSPGCSAGRRWSFRRTSAICSGTSVRGRQAGRG